MVLNWFRRRATRSAGVLMILLICSTPTRLSAQRSFQERPFSSVPAPAIGVDLTSGRAVSAIPTDEIPRLVDVETPLVPLPSDSTRIRDRIKPYILLGFVAGAALGYAAHEEVFWKRDDDACDLGDISYCRYTPHLYIAGGIAVGGFAGAVVGWIRER